MSNRSPQFPGSEQLWRFLINRPLRIATVTTAATADNMAGVVERAVDVEPDEIGGEHEEGDP